MTSEIDCLDLVAVTGDLPERGLQRGQAGAVIEILAPGVFEVEFSDNEGRTYAQAALRSGHLMALHIQPVAV